MCELKFVLSIIVEKKFFHELLTLFLSLYFFTFTILFIVKFVPVCTAQNFYYTMKFIVKLNFQTFSLGL